MLEKIRESAQGWISWVILTLITLAFSLWGIQSYIHHGSSAITMAKVDGHTILQTTWEGAVKRAYRQLMVTQKRTTLTEAEEAQLKSAVLQQMIEEYIRVSAANQAGFSVSDEQVLQLQMSIPGFQENGQFSPRLFKRILSQMALSEAQFYTDMRHDIISNQVQQAFIESAFALPQEVDTAVKLVQQKRNIAYVVFPLTQFKEKMIAKPEQLKQFYQKHQQRWMIPEQVKLQYLRLSSENFLKNHKVDAQQIKDYYENNKQQFSIPAQWQVAHILIKVAVDADETTVAQAKARADKVYQSLQQGANFSNVAKKYSDDPLTRNQGGILGWVQQGMLDSILQQTVVNLKPGQISKPVRSKYGYGVIKLIAVKAAKVKPLNEVHKTIEQAVTTHSMNQWFAEKNEELSDLVYANPDNLTVAAEQLGLTLKETPFITRAGGQQAISKNQDVLKAAFSQEVLNQGYNSNPIELGTQSMVVVRVKQHKAAHVARYEDVKSQVKEQYLREMANKKAFELAQQQVEKLAGAKPLSQIAQQLDLKLNWKKGITRFEVDTIDVAIRDAAFSLARTSATRAAARVVKLSNGDVALVTVTAIQPGQFDKKSAKTEQSIFSDELAHRYGTTDYDCYMRSLVAKSKVKIYSKLKKA